ncbi:hypothetical protein FR934_17915 [Synechocystis sp. PCC 6803]|jgi:hypothetical protein|nr:hypothetical protein C7I86_18230 [Synechocystis sp. IPPAS B-1465]MCW5242570.1 hypothetical protein [Synechocystis sp. PCC 6803]
MAGTKSSGRPGGNPDITNFSFTTDRPEPCTAKLTLRLPPTDYEKLRALENWQELVREKIKELIA